MAKKAPRNPILDALRHASQDERKAVEFLERNRWGDSPICPRCRSNAVYPMRSKSGDREKNYRWRCRDCKRMYSVRTGLIFEETRLPLRIWVYAFWKACASKKGISALQISRECEISYKSALYLMHRIRFAMASDPLDGGKLSGTVEADETLVGGKPRHRGPRGKNPTGHGTNKAIVMGMVERGGRVRTRHIDRITARNLQGAVMELVDKNARLVTDEEASYRGLWKLRSGAHETVKHKAREYVRGDVYTNTIESHWSLIKRGVYGTFHSVSKHHLHRYLSEFEFRWNHRYMDDGERTLAALRGGEGKRLSYFAS